MDVVFNAVLCLVALLCWWFRGGVGGCGVTKMEDIVDFVQMKLWGYGGGCDGEAV